MSHFPLSWHVLYSMAMTGDDDDDDDGSCIDNDDKHFVNDRVDDEYVKDYDDGSTQS